MRERWTMGALDTLPGLLGGLVGPCVEVAVTAHSDLGAGPPEIA